jgi:NAD(P)-dependent dehydrogenase (short-subunit alcohol dehydrogenase family)
VRDESERMELSGKVAIITGGDSGIGAAISELFSEEGASVVIADIHDSGTAAQIARKGGRALYVKTDVRNEAEVKRLITQTSESFGGIDIVCNNAGIVLLRPLTKTTAEEWERVLQTNLKSVFLVSKHAIPEMLRRGGGAIVNTASQLGLVGLENYTAYTASKGGVIQLTKSMALEYARQNIRVNCICPGPVQTPMLEAELLTERDPEAARRMWAQRQPIGRVGLPREIAQAALYLASDRSSFVVGHALVVDGGYTLA